LTLPVPQSKTMIPPPSSSDERLEAALRRRSPDAVWGTKLSDAGSTIDWTASIPPEAVPADIKQKPRTFLRGFCRLLVRLSPLD
jgi:hypothetical protein